MPKVFEVIVKGMRLVFKEIIRLKGKLHEGHKADGLYFRCCDFRFRDVGNQFLNGLENGLFDVFSFPGGATMMLLGAKYGHPDMREAVLYWIEKMLALHHTNKIYMEAHGKHNGRCGAYASTASLAGKSDEELCQQQMEDLLEMKSILQERFPDAIVTIIYDEADEPAEAFAFSSNTSSEPMAKAA